MHDAVTYARQRNGTPRVARARRAFGRDAPDAEVEAFGHLKQLAEFVEPRRFVEVELMRGAREEMRPPLRFHVVVDHHDAGRGRMVEDVIAGRGDAAHGVGHGHQVSGACRAVGAAIRGRAHRRSTTGSRPACGPSQPCPSREPRHGSRRRGASASFIGRSSLASPGACMSGGACRRAGRSGARRIGAAKVTRSVARSKIRPATKFEAKNAGPASLSQSGFPGCHRSISFKTAAAVTTRCVLMSSSTDPRL